MKQKILFICQHNSGRSQMAEAYLKRFAGDQLEVESAGLQPAERVNPLVVEVMKEDASFGQRQCGGHQIADIGFLVQPYRFARGC